MHRMAWLWKLGASIFTILVIFLVRFLWYAISKVNCRKQYSEKYHMLAFLNGNLYIIWMTLFVNLFFISAFGRTFNHSWFICNLFSNWNHWWDDYSKRISSIRTRLYEEPTDNGFQFKQIQLVTGFAGGIVAIWMILKFFFHKSEKLELIL